MLRGEWIRDGWKSEEVKEALDLCLSCKGCRSDCPTHVDMATYKAEFLSHYYSGRLRPRAAYVMGMIGEWAPLAGAAPWLANFPFRIGWLSRALKSLAGIAPERDIPAFARRNFRAEFSKRNSSSRRGTRVLLWPDTFTNYFEPEIALAAIEVLEHAGCDVHIPQHRLCCGRPLYDFGMVRLARRRLMQIMDALAADIEAGVPVVGLEPACVAVFRDELVNLFPRDQRARKLAQQVFMLSEFLVQHAKYRPPALRARALVHEHCHHKAVLGTADEATLLQQMGLDFHVLDSGCCGMAGSFGFDRDKYQVSMRIGESILLPQVRNAPVDTLILADGYSCREQIRQGTNRETLHLAQLIQLAIRAQDAGAAEEKERERDARPVIASM
jgi:Fe-S oxidoreductase